jgi:hypothetical protein
MRRTFSKENTAWTRVRLEEVVPIVGFLLAGIVASLAVLLLEKVIKKRTFMQKQQNVFCCISAVRYVDVGHPDHRNSSQRNVSREVERYSRVRALKHQGPREVVWAIPSNNNSQRSKN